MTQGLRHASAGGMQVLGVRRRCSRLVLTAPRRCVHNWPDAGSGPVVPAIVRQGCPRRGQAALACRAEFAADVDVAALPENLLLLEELTRQTGASGHSQSPSDAGQCREVPQHLPLCSVSLLTRARARVRSTMASAAALRGTSRHPRPGPVQIDASATPSMNRPVALFLRVLAAGTAAARSRPKL